MRKPAFCICENKDADQLCAVTAQLISALFSLHSKITLLPNFKISGLQPFSVSVQPGLCQSETWSETPKTGFLASQLKYEVYQRTVPVYSFNYPEMEKKAFERIFP